MSAPAPRPARRLDPIRSPCVGICELDGDHCRGCRRTLDEIAGWLKYSPAQRDAIISQLDSRRAAAMLADSRER